MPIDKSRIVRIAEWFYDKTIRCQVVIQSETFFPGSGDYEDSPEIADDRNVPCFSVWYEIPAQRGSIM